MITEQEAVRRADYAIAGLDEAFAELVRRRAKLAQAKAIIEAELATNGATLLETLQDKKLESVSVDGRWSVTACKGRAGNKRIDGGRLLRLGVTGDIIQKATVQGEPGSPYVMVRDAAGGAK